MPSLVRQKAAPLEMKLHPTRSVLLADDDEDDCSLFQEALNEIALSTQLTTVHNGEQLMQQLEKSTSELPDVVFLDLNMPRKNGFDCLTEIKQNKKLTQLDVIIISTSFQQEVADLLYKNGARYFIRKPNDFQDLKKIINQALTIINVRSTIETFVLT